MKLSPAFWYTFGVLLALQIIGAWLVAPRIRLLWGSQYLMAGAGVLVLRPVYWMGWLTLAGWLIGFSFLTALIIVTLLSAAFSRRRPPESWLTTSG